MLSLQWLEEPPVEVLSDQVFTRPQGFLRPSFRTNQSPSSSSGIATVTHRIADYTALDGNYADFHDRFSFLGVRELCRWCIRFLLHGTRVASYAQEILQ